MIIGIILAAGKGTRIKTHGMNKVTIPFLNKPLIMYGVELMEKNTDKTLVVVGAYKESVKKALVNKDVTYVHQQEQSGTGHAVKMAVADLVFHKFSPDTVLVGYGDHTMFYRSDTVGALISLHRKKQAAVSFISVDYPLPNKLAWGRIIRDSSERVIDIIEQKDAREDQLKIQEINAGFYCFDYQFLLENVDSIPCSPISGEYYINSLIPIAVKQNKQIAVLKVSFDEVGVGINKTDEIKESEKIYLGRN